MDLIVEERADTHVSRRQDGQSALRISPQAGDTRRGDSRTRRRRSCRSFQREGPKVPARTTPLQGGQQRRLAANPCTTRAPLRRRPIYFRGCANAFSLLR